MIEETAALNVSTVRLKLLGCVSRYQWDIVRGKNDFLSLLSITRRYNENRTRNVCVVIVSRAVFFSNSYIFVCCFILDDKSTPVFKTVPVHVTTCQQHQIATSQILMVYTQNVCTCCQARSSLYANTQLRAHRRAEETKIKSKKNKINKE